MATQVKKGLVPLYLVYKNGSFNQVVSNEAHAQALVRYHQRDGHSADYEVDYVDACVRCGKAAPFSVDWLFPSKRVDSRPICSSACGVKVIA